MEARLYGFISVSRKRHKRRCQLNIYKLKMPTGQVSHKSHSPTEDVSPGADGITRWLQECTEPVIQFSMGTTPSDLFKHFGVWRQDKSFEHITGRTFFKRLTGLIDKTPRPHQTPSPATSLREDMFGLLELSLSPDQYLERMGTT
jgi:hypothetical protein